MKRFWLILLSLGLVMAFSASAFAVDVKVSGSFYAAGMYLNKISVADTDKNLSTAFFYQRLRVETDFIIDPSLKLVTRFDAMERIWGGMRSDAGTTLAIDSAGTRAENENIAIDWAYINYKSPVGTFEVGIMNYGATGTIFGNGYYPAGRIKYYSNPINGSFNINADFSKLVDKSYSAVNSSASWTDADKDAYAIEGVYSWKDGKAALKGFYYRYADNRPPASSTTPNALRDYFVVTPWTMFKIGPVALQAELNYAFGKYSRYDDYVNHVTTPDVRMENISGWIDATATFAPVYVGATVAYVSGDDPGTTDVKEGGILTGGFEWNPCLIMFNYYDLSNWVGPVYGNDYTAPTSLGASGTGMVTGPMSNAWFLQGRVGVKPTPKLDAILSVSYAQADKKPKGYTNSTYGTEVDLTGTYKITDNLSYMLGFGYLFTGDYFKGKDTPPDNKVVDDFIIMNKLTLTF
jgi:hypothetical protein